MNKNQKWTIYQVIALITIVVSFYLLHSYIDTVGIQSNDSRSILLIGGMLYIPISWIYLMIYFQQKKQPKLMEQSIWRILPVILIGVSIISLIAFIMLVTMGPLLDWMEQSSWILYIFVTYATGLYFLFILSIVYRMSESKHNVIHHSYVWALVVIIGISFLF